MILLSHGTAGIELGHSSPTEAFAQRDYLVAALPHPGDNFQDTSLRDGTGSVGAPYFTQRPLQVSQVIDALLRDPLWKDRVASDSNGHRIRAVVAMSPASVMFTPDSLARITVPTLLYRAEKNRFLVPRFHVGWLVQNMPHTQAVSMPLTRRFAFMDTPSMPLMTPDGDVGAGAPGCDRSVFLEKLGLN